MNAAMQKHADEWVSELRQDPERYQRFQSGLMDAKSGKERMAFLVGFAAQERGAQAGDSAGAPPAMLW